MKMETERKMIKLKSTEGYVFEIDVKYFCNSITVQNMLEAFGSDDLDKVVIPVRISSPILKKVMEWLEHHEENLMVKEVSEWDNNLLHSLASEVYHLLEAADYLELQGLLQVISIFLSKIINEEPKETLYKALKFLPNKKDSKISKQTRSEDSTSQMEEHSNVSKAKRRRGKDEKDENVFYYP